MAPCADILTVGHGRKMPFQDDSKAFAPSKCSDVISVCWWPGALAIQDGLTTTSPVKMICHSAVSARIWPLLTHSHWCGPAPRGSSSWQVSQDSFPGRVLALASPGCSNKPLHTWQLKATHVHFPIVLEARNSTSLSLGQSQGAGRAALPREAPGRICLLAFPSFQRRPHSLARGPPSAFKASSTASDCGGHVASLWRVQSPSDPLTRSLSQHTGLTQLIEMFFHLKTPHHSCKVPPALRANSLVSKDQDLISSGSSLPQPLTPIP